MLRVGDLMGRSLSLMILIFSFCVWSGIFIITGILAFQASSVIANTSEEVVEIAGIMERMEIGATQIGFLALFAGVGSACAAVASWKQKRWGLVLGILLYVATGPIAQFIGPGFVEVHQTIEPRFYTSEALTKMVMVSNSYELLDGLRKMLLPTMVGFILITLCVFANAWNELEPSGKKWRMEKISEPV
jgi:hypothetical protein